MDASRATVLWTSGPIPLWVRLISLPFLAGTLWLAGRGIADRIASESRWAGSPASLVGGLIASVILVAFFAGLWIWNNWMYVDTSGDMVVLAHRGLLGRSQRTIRIAEVRAISLHPGSIRAGHFWDVSLVTSKPEKIWFTRIYGEPDAPPRDSFARLAEHLRCQVVVE